MKAHTQSKYCAVRDTGGVKNATETKGEGPQKGTAEEKKEGSVRKAADLERRDEMMGEE